MERIGESVRRLQRGNVTADAGALAAIVRAWPAAVGEPIARAAWPARIARDGTLHVSTASSTWAFELTGLAHEIATRLQSALGEEAPAALRFAPGPLPEPSADRRPEAAREPAAPSPQDRSAAAALASVIEDEDLRRSVARAAAASLARQRSDRGF